MTIYNITFIVPPSQRAAALEWIGRRVEHLAASPTFTGSAVSLSEVVEVPGMPDYGTDTVSITAGFRFSSTDEARRWGAERFDALAGAFAKTFGSEALAMPSIIDELLLKTR